jgi:transaldolase
MNKAQELHDLARASGSTTSPEILDNGTLRRYGNQFSITGLTEPDHLRRSVGNTQRTTRIRDRARAADRRSALHRAGAEDLRLTPTCSAAFDAQRWRRRVGIDGGLAYCARHRGQHQAAARITGRRAAESLSRFQTPEGLPAIRIDFCWCPINVTLLFARAIRGQPRPICAASSGALRQRDPRVASGRFAVRQPMGQGRGREGVGPVTQPARHRDRRPHLSRVSRVASRRRAGASSPQRARPQRLLWASTGTKDPKASDTLYVEALAAPDTIDTMPEKTLRAFTERGKIKGVMAEDGGDAEEVLARFAKADIDVDALALALQRDGAQAFVKSWNGLLKRITDKSEALAEAR